jgi:prepilin-type N-terminal cleavage/methylation domain-containing protein
MILLPFQRRRNARRRGFTLIEASLASVIIGVGVMAMMELFAACTRQNMLSGKRTTGMMLAQSIMEATSSLPFRDPGGLPSPIGPETGEVLATFDDVDDFDLMTLNPPIDATRTQLPELAQYTQIITVLPVYPNKPNSNNNEFSLEIPKSTYTGAVRVRVRVLYRANPDSPAEEVYRLSWIRLDK